MSRVRLLADWLFDWLVLPVWEALFARGGKDDGKQEAPGEEPPRG